MYAYTYTDIYIYIQYLRSALEERRAPPFA